MSQEDEYGKNMVNLWWIRLQDGVEMVLVSNLVKDRQWMEQENPQGHTPWMHLAVPFAAAAASRHEDKPIVSARNMKCFIEGRGRANMDSVAAVTHVRVELEGYLPD